MCKSIICLLIVPLVLVGCSSPSTPGASEPSAVEQTTEAPAYDATVGEPFEFRTTDADETPRVWTITVTNVELVDEIPDAADNPDYYSGDLDQPETITATAQEGYDLLRVDYTLRNDNSDPDSIFLEAAVAMSDGEVYAPLGDDARYGEILTWQNESPVGQTQNPNTEAQGSFVVEVVEGSDVDALIITEYAIDSMSEYWVDLGV